MSKLLGFVLLCVVVGWAAAQVPPPKFESKLSHIFGPHRDQDNLEQRSANLSCALVLIVAGERTGTGFYVSSDGDVATAAHILGEKMFVGFPNGTWQVTIAGPDELTIKDSSSETPQSYKRDDILEKNANAWAADVVLLKTKKRVTCWLKPGDDQNIHAGQHVLTLGFPGLAFGSLSMYSGIVSSAKLRSNLPIAAGPNKMLITSTVEFIRTQMPISPGLSGAPLIDDDNHAIGVITSAGAWSPYLDLLLQKTREQEQKGDLPTGEVLDTQFLVGKLAEIFHDYGSPGYGDAVPMRYLKQPPAGLTP